MQPINPFTVIRWVSRWMSGEEERETVIASEPVDLALEYSHSDSPANSPYVAHGDFHFLIGDGREIRVRLRHAPPEGATINWEVCPTGEHGGTVAPITTHARQCTFTPTVTEAQRPVTGSRAPNLPVSYAITVTVIHDGETHTATETITQDERDIIRQEYLDFRMFRQGFRLEIPTREEITEPDPAEFGQYSNYTLVVDRGMGRMYANTRAGFGEAITINSAWRNPRRNRAVNGVLNSEHQNGRAVDMRAADRDSVGAAARRRDFLALYRAAMNAGGTQVLLERNSTQLLPADWDPPQPTKEDPDEDGDGLPDKATGPGAYTRNLRDIFDDATHVHGSW